MQATIEANIQNYYEKMKKLTEYLTEMITSMTDQIKILKRHDTTTVVLTDKRDTPLKCGHYTKIVECLI